MKQQAVDADSRRMAGGTDMTLERYYRFINTGIGKKIKEVLNGLIPGLVPEPVPVRVPVRQPQRVPGSRRRR